jgi:hypothetical protein
MMQLSFLAILDTIADMDTETAKVAIESLEIVFSECAALRDHETFDSWAALERRIAYATTKAPVGGCYDKTHLKLTWADGFTYEARIDLTRGMTSLTPVADHVRNFCEIRSGRKPMHWLDDNGAAYLKTCDNYDPDGRKNCAHVLDNLMLED